MVETTATALALPTIDGLRQRTVRYLGKNSAALVRIAPYPHMTAGDRVEVTWSSAAGQHTTQVAVTAAAVGHPVLVRIPPEVVEASIGPAAVGYTVITAPAGERASEQLHFTVTA